IVPGSEPDGGRILTWTQLYDLGEVPEHLVVVGSGVTGAEFAGAYNLLGSRVTLISSGDRVLANQDPEAAEHVQQVFLQRGMELVTGTPPVRVTATGAGAQVEAGAGRGGA